MKDNIIGAFKASSEIINRYLNGRRVAFYGDSDELQSFLKEEYGIDDVLSLTNIENKTGNGKLHISTLSDRSNDFYIIIPSAHPTDDLKKLFGELGFIEFSDYIFLSRKSTLIPPGAPDYKDEYGNLVHSGGCTVSLDKYVCNAYVNIDDSFTGNFKVRIFGNGGARVEIGPGCKAGVTCRAFIHENGVLKIGYGVTMGDNTKISVMGNNTVTIGNDCMLSYDVMIFSGDGHAIFDMETGMRTNLYLDGDPKGTITLGSHVWIGAGCYILNRSEIGNSCILGAASVFKGELPDFSAAAGNPARIVKRNVTWSRNPKAEDIGECFKTWQGDAFAADED